MIYSPNKLERYTAALRNTLQHFVLSQGNTQKLKEGLKKIYLAEAIHSAEILPLSLSEYTAQLYNSTIPCILNRNRKIKFNLSVKGVYLINIKAYTALILLLLSQSDYLCVKNHIEKIVIISKSNPTDTVIKIVNSLNGSVFYDIKKGKILIALRTVKTNKPPYNPHFLNEEAFNPFSLPCLFH